MGDDYSEIIELKNQIIRLNFELQQEKFQSQEYEEYSDNLKKVQYLNSCILNQSQKLRDLKAQEKLFLQSISPKQFTQRYEFISPLKSKLEYLYTEIKNRKEARQQKIEFFLENYKGKGIIHSQLKILLQKEKLFADLKYKVKVAMMKKNAIQEEYYEITKRLSQDNNLTQKIKQTETLVSQKAIIVNELRPKLGKLRANIQEIKLVIDDVDIEAINKKAEELNEIRRNNLAKIEELKKQIIEIEISIQNPSKDITSDDTSCEVQRNEIKALEEKLSLKEKELKNLTRIKNSAKIEYSKTLKEIISKKKIKSNDLDSSPNKSSVTELKYSPLSQSNTYRTSSILKSELNGEVSGRSQGSTKSVGFNFNRVAVKVSLTKK